jgi:hypothetical protein
MVEKFPVFLKTETESNFYCIWSEIHMQEWQRIGSKGILIELHAQTMPDRWVISDILNNTHGHCVPISEQEWRTVTRIAK